MDEDAQYVILTLEGETDPLSRNVGKILHPPATQKCYDIHVVGFSVHHVVC